MAKSIEGQLEVSMLHGTRIMPACSHHLHRVLMDNLSPAQYDRFEAYRRHALPKQAVRKVIQQTLGQQVSQPVAQIIAGFSKVFVGEIVEKGDLSFSNHAPATLYRV